MLLALIRSDDPEPSLLIEVDDDAFDALCRLHV
jgi:hypothetical protein